MKKRLYAALALMLCALSCPALALDAEGVLVGACFYKFDDTFMTGVRNAMAAEMKELGGELEIMDSQNRQPLQNDQVDAYIARGVNALIVAPVVSPAALPLIDKAKAEGLPIIFINREPPSETMGLYDKVWYVGARAEESGIQSAEILADYFKSHPEADKNRDGKVQYVILRGTQGHQDAPIRTEYALKTLRDAGLILDGLGNDTANFNKVEATDKMKGFISSAGIDNIEAVLANNDDMALGAIEALKADGYNLGDPAKYIPVVGVDATAPALEAMKEGALLGTVLNDAVNQGRAVVRAAVAAASGKPVSEETIGYPVTGGKYIWIPYSKVTRKNYMELM